MKLFFNISLCLSLLLSMSIYAQNKRANVWLFGRGYSGSCSGLNFNNEPSTYFLGGAIDFTMQGASISDTSGNLQFYTNGETVMNALHDTMPNGTGLLGKNQGGFNNVVIVPKPLSDNIYYIFYVTWYYDGVKMHEELDYSIVDMNLDNGNGDVVQKNIVLCDSISQRVAATFHANKRDVWVVVHKLSGDEYNSFLVTPDSIMNSPIVSHSGTLYNENYIYSTGQIKISGNGCKISASMRIANDSTDISLFNNLTGIISNSITIKLNADGVEFSPDNLKLYGFIGTTFYQYDLSNWDKDSILSSKYEYYAGDTYTSKLGVAQLAPDGKIYIARNSKNYLGVINSPNATGVACDFVLDGFYLNGKTSSYVLPNFISSYFDFSTSVKSPMLSNSKIEVYPNPAVNQLTVISKQLSANGNKLVLYDLFGKEVLSTEIKEQTIDISQVPQGVYVYKIIDNKGILKSGKLVVVK